MHCTICDALLSDFEATRKNAITGEYLDMCSSCYQDFKEIIPTKDRRDLLTQSDIDLELDDLEPEHYNQQRWSDDL